ncbi:hypothetical protein BDV96DRAFT_597926 [Lophiotrema nucula]|uniref:Uncharacterized protein n=1 Tax=Lophiotrema nucula TaxID=690887 RepID=A0A6A5ZBX6_9PLEO|nr:hypothetical protein BDV96DRAFT_597926 [Lophiotrema nucula]
MPSRRLETRDSDDNYIRHLVMWDLRNRDCNSPMQSTDRRQRALLGWWQLGWVLKLNERACWTIAAKNSGTHWAQHVDYPQSLSLWLLGGLTLLSYFCDLLIRNKHPECSQ